MALKKEPPVKAAEQETKSSLSAELTSQFQNNFTAPSLIETEPEPEKPQEPEQPKIQEPQAEKKKLNYKNIFNVHMGTGDKARLKAFCAAREVPINTFILYAIEHLIDEIEEGKCSVSKSGIRVLKKDN